MEDLQQLLDEALLTVLAALPIAARLSDYVRRKPDGSVRIRKEPTDSDDVESLVDGVEAAEVETTLGQVVWVCDVDDTRTPWTCGRVEGHCSASGKALVRAVEGRLKGSGHPWSVAECADPRAWEYLRTAAPGFTENMLGFRGSSWGAARDCNGLSPCQAAGRGALTLLGWHLLQPALYFYVFVGAFSDLDTAQQVLGSLVGFREGVYAVSVVACVVVNPAFLLVDMGATVREQADWVTQVGQYVAAPEKFVVRVLTQKGGLGMGSFGFVWKFIVGPLLDLCGMAALGAGLGAGPSKLPPPLAVGYSITTAGALFFAAFLIHRGITEKIRKPVAYGLGGLVCCVSAVFVPLLVLSQP
eukprot:COSAG02_NODE_4550_length_5224_cov_94.387512_2_plen_357_part_00